MDGEQQGENLPGPITEQVAIADTSANANAEGLPCRDEASPTKTHTQYTVDRTRWRRGPWDAEPDRLQWTHAGFACLIVRNLSGALCGYVGVPAGHLAYGKSYEVINVEVHGDLTYSDKCDGAICHIPDVDMPDDVWWLGFDCMHGGDAYPSQMRYHFGGDVYRTIGYVKGQVEYLARQLRDPAAFSIDE